MPLLNNYVISQILIPVVFTFLLISGLFGVGLGVGLIVFRDRVFRRFGPMNRWVSTQKSLESMEARRDIEPFIRKHRRWFGGFFALGGIFSIVVLVARVNATAVASMFGPGHSSVIVPWFIQSLAAFLLIGSVLAIAIGLILVFFPELLGAIETRTDRWYAPRQIIKGADEMHLPLDRWVEASPRAAGWMLVVASVFLAIASALVLYGHR